MDIYKQALSVGISIAPGPLFSNRELEISRSAAEPEFALGRALGAGSFTNWGAILRQKIFPH
jgi:hypothetical protein